MSAHEAGGGREREGTPHAREAAIGTIAALAAAIVAGFSSIVVQAQSVTGWVTFAVMLVVAAALLAVSVTYIGKARRHS
ncbi:MAG: hypothetical protein AB7V42_10020 [Thermoleophilia bacterium]